MAMRRGQAFETMMLVISVIVALAILAVLMNIIGGINGVGQTAPDKLMNSALSTQVSTGYGCSAPQAVTFQRGTSIFADQVRGSIVSLTDSDTLTFSVDSALTGITAKPQTAPFTATGQAKLSVAGTSAPQTAAYMVVCVNAQSAVKTVNICIGPSDSSATITGCAPK